MKVVIIKKVNKEKMLRKNLLLIKMEKKVSKLCLVVLFLVTLISCNSSQKTKNSIYGKWVDIENNNLIVNIDSLTNQLTIDYTASGGKLISSMYKLNSKNEFVSTILPKGAEFVFDENGLMRIYPVKKEYTRDLEIIYVLRFKKIK